MSFPMWFEDNEQEAADSFYWRNGPCCAGCDWWARVNSLVGECRKSAPVSAAERGAVLGIEGCSLVSGAGHILTPREHHCGDFKDDFDWSMLPLAYRKKIAAPDMPRHE